MTELTPSTQTATLPIAVQLVAAGDSNIGRTRASNQDSGYSGFNLFFVADGMGGHAGGDIASAIVTHRVAQVDAIYDSPDAAAEAMRAAMISANRKLSATVEEHGELAGMGTTFSGLMVVGSKIAIAHIGDSRIYLARGGSVKQITKDHTFVQRLVDTGRITPEEALVHPRRSVLMRVLGDVEDAPEIDLLTLGTKPGDRWMLCSDGLSGVVPDEVLEKILLDKSGPDEACELLVYEALEHGAPDNVTVVLVDIKSAAYASQTEPVAEFLGSAANDVVVENTKDRRFLRLLNPRNLPEVLGINQDPAAFLPESEQYLELILSQTKSRVRLHRFRQMLAALLALLIVCGALFAAYSYTQTRFYIGESSTGKVAIFKGIHESFGSLKFSELYKETSTNVKDLTLLQQDEVRRTISADNLVDAYIKFDMMLAIEGK
jgi:serine/threonine protein phosphatase PrpC